MLRVRVINQMWKQVIQSKFLWHSFLSAIIINFVPKRVEREIICEQTKEWGQEEESKMTTEEKKED